MPKITDPRVKAARPGTTLWDDSLKGFGVRVGKNRKTFIVLIESGRRQSIGTYPLMTLADARTEAKIILAEKTLGKVRPKYTAFDDAKADFLAECANKNKPRTVYDYDRLLTLYYPFARKSVGDITPRQILKKLNAINDRPSERHHAFVAGKIFFTWCVRQHIIDRSPWKTSPFHEGPLQETGCSPKTSSWPCIWPPEPPPPPFTTS